MKIIFLDIDGVLCTYRMHVSKLAVKYRGDGVVKNENWMTDFDPVSCGLLLEVCKRYDDIRIVLSSTWRLLGQDYEMFLSRLETYCPELIKYLMMPSEEHPEIYKIPDLIGETRDCEIGEWLKKYSDVLNVDKYIIIDDEIPVSKTHEGHYIQCDIYEGFGFKNYLKCLYIFDGSPDYLLIASNMNLKKDSKKISGSFIICKKDELIDDDKDV